MNERPTLTTQRWLGGPRAALSVAATLLALACTVAPAPRGEGQDRIVICHKGGNTLTIAEPAWEAHRRHGDTLGPCR